jgi:hypothetical protein
MDGGGVPRVPPRRTLPRRPIAERGIIARGTGEGADTLVCGPGVDTVVADAADTIRADCEKVTGLAKPALSVADVAQPEGNGPSTLSFTVTLAQATRLPVTVAYATADGTASAGSDYTAASGQLAFAPGEASKTIAVPVSGDTVVEADETFSLTLSNPVNATLGRATATATIRNDDQASTKPKPGHYHGPIASGGVVDFDLSADGSSVTNLTIVFYITCRPSLSGTDSVRFDDVIPIQPDGSFGGSGSGTGITVSFGGALKNTDFLRRPGHALRARHRQLQLGRGLAQLMAERGSAVKRLTSTERSCPHHPRVLARPRMVDPRSRPEQAALTSQGPGQTRSRL